MNLAKLVAGTVDMPVTHPATGENTGLTITIASQDDPEVIKAQQANASDDETSEDDKLDNVLAAAIKEFHWEDDADFDGKKLEANKSGKKKVLSSPVIRRQVLNQYLKYKDFFSA